MLVSDRGRGVAIPTALFIALLVFFLSTVILARARHQLRLTQISSHQTQRSYAAWGAVNQAIASLNDGEAWEEHGAGNPIRTSTEYLEAEAWVVQDPDFPEILHVLARAYPKGQPGLAVQRARTIRKKPDAEAIVVTTSHIDDGPEAVSYKRSTEAGWTPIPPPEKNYYLGGTLHTNPGEYCQHLFGLQADNQGRIHAVYYNAIDDSAFLTTLMNGIISQGSEDGISQREFPFAVIKEGYGPEILGQMSEASLLEYDLSADRWTAVPTPPAFKVVGSDLVPTGEVVHATTANSDGKALWVTEGGSRVIYEREFASDTWIPHQGPGRHVYDTSGNLLEADTFTAGVIPYDGGLYAMTMTMEGKNSAFHRRRDDGSWEVLPPVPRSYYENGSLVTEPGSAWWVDHGEAGPNGELVCLWKRGKETGSGGDTILQFKDGAWQAMEPPPMATISSDGTVTVGTGPTDNISQVAVDMNGDVVVRSVRKNGPDVIYRHDGTEWSVLPPTPRKFYDDDGKLVSQPGFLESVFHVSAGGAPAPESAVAFEVVATY